MSSRKGRKKTGWRELLADIKAGTVPRPKREVKYEAKQRAAENSRKLNSGWWRG